MRVSSRFSLKTLIGLVGLVGLTFGIAVELQNRQGRDASAAAVQINRLRASWHSDQVTACREAIEQGRAYSPRDRNVIHRRAVRTLDIKPADVPFQGWATEETYHRYWARWYAEQADIAARTQQVYQQRLLCPF